MEIELLVRVPDLSSERMEESKEENKLKRLLEGDLEDDVKVEFKFEPYSLNLRDVVMYGRDGKELTKIYLPFGILIAKINYSVFKRIKEAAIGVRVKTIDDFKE